LGIASLSIFLFIKFYSSHEDNIYLSFIHLKFFDKVKSKIS